MTMVTIGVNVSWNDSGECVRLKNFVSHSTITGNTIKHCGVFDFGGENDFHAGDDSDDGDREVNGEGIYIGTSITQVGRSYLLFYGKVGGRYILGQPASN